MSQESTLAFSVPFEEASEFLSAVQEIPNEHKTLEASRTHEPEDGVEFEEKKWIMKAAKGDTRGSQASWSRWARNAWAEFVDLLKVGSLLAFEFRLLTKERFS
jgi:hydroxymethylglutaryl-CoA reductase (NADPH)